MKRFNWIYAFLLMSVCLSAQTVTQKGVTYRYNGKNPRTPIMKQKYEADIESLRNDYTNNLGSQSFYCVFAIQYAEAEQNAREGLFIDSTEHWIASNLAAALLFQGKYDEVEQIYRQYKNELKDSFLDDFKQFGEAGVIPKEYEADVERIKKLLNE